MSRVIRIVCCIVSFDLRLMASQESARSTLLQARKHIDRAASETLRHAPALETVFTGSLYPERLAY